ncbi:MAG: 7-carboxy-7-deazaguanine synthase QueE [Candidatus Dadabacteria bacterium]|nr:7-carboxy-7-deazaguanine synthase QueE [Candidatus Dadabacteria bacterium]
MKAPEAQVVDIFSSIQGEGVFVGAKQVFVRFKNCNLTCSFCDEPKDRPAAIYTPRSLMRAINLITDEKGPHHSVSLTGGEPLCHADFLLSFLPFLRRNRMRSYLETNGTLPDALTRVIDLVDIVAMDFKLPSSTGLRAFWGEHLDFLKIASKKKVFVKAVITANTTSKDIEKAISIINGMGKNIPFILQPATSARDGDKEVGKERLLEFLEMGTRGDLEHIQVIPQLHKIKGIK